MFWLVGLIAIGIIFIGIRFIVAPRTAVFMCVLAVFLLRK
jgi:hypothetical protein